MCENSDAIEVTDDPYGIVSTYDQDADVDEDDDTLGMYFRTAVESTSYGNALIAEVTDVAISGKSSGKGIGASSPSEVANGKGAGSVEQTPYASASITEVTAEAITGKSSGKGIGASFPSEVANGIGAASSSEVAKGADSDKDSISDEAYSAAAAPLEMWWMQQQQLHQQRPL